MSKANTTTTEIEAKPSLIDAAHAFCEQGEILLAGIRRYKPTIDDPIPSDRYAVARLHEMMQEAQRGLARNDDQFICDYYLDTYSRVSDLLGFPEKRDSMIQWARLAYAWMVEQGNEYNPRCAISVKVIEEWSKGTKPRDFARWTLMMDNAHYED